MHQDAELRVAKATTLINDRLQKGAQMTPAEQVAELAMALLEQLDGTDSICDELTEFGLGETTFKP